MPDRGEQMRQAFAELCACAERLADVQLTAALLRLMELFTESAQAGSAIITPALQRTSSGRRALARVSGLPPQPRCRDDR